MTKLTNPTAGPKGIWVPEKDAAYGGSMLWVEPGETVEVQGIPEPYLQGFTASGGVVVTDEPSPVKRGPGRPPKAE